MRRPEVGAAFLAAGAARPLLGKDMVSLEKLRELGGLEDRDGWTWPGQPAPAGRATASISSQFHILQLHACSLKLTRGVYLRHESGQTR